MSCPTCGRTRIDLISLAGQVETMAAEFDDLDIKVAVMGCVVNGPGEAREADIGIAGGVGEGTAHQKGTDFAQGAGGRASFRPAGGAFGYGRGTKEVDKHMAKDFLEVFPTLNIAQPLKDLLALVQVEKVSSSRDRSRIRIYLNSTRLIHKQNIYDLERGIKDQLFPPSRFPYGFRSATACRISIRPRSFWELYKDSLLLELKNYSMIEYTMFRKAEIVFEKEDRMVLTVEDTPVNRTKTAELKRVLEKVFGERCGLPVEVKFQYVPAKPSNRRQMLEEKIAREALAAAGYGALENGAAGAEGPVLEAPPWMEGNAPLAGSAAGSGQAAGNSSAGNNAAGREAKGRTNGQASGQSGTARGTQGKGSRRCGKRETLWTSGRRHRGRRPALAAERRTGAGRRENTL